MKSAFSLAEEILCRSRCCTPQGPWWKYGGGGALTSRWMPPKCKHARRPEDARTGGRRMQFLHKEPTRRWSGGMALYCHWLPISLPPTVSGATFFPLQISPPFSFHDDFVSKLQNNLEWPLKKVCLPIFTEQSHVPYVGWLDLYCIGLARSLTI